MKDMKNKNRRSGITGEAPLTVQVRSLRCFLNMALIRERMITQEMTVIAVLSSNPLIAKLSAAPEAGGCSKSATTIIKMDTPTATE